MIAPVQSQSHQLGHALSPGRVPVHARTLSSAEKGISGTQGFLPWWKSFVLLLVMLHNEVVVPLAIRFDNTVCSVAVPLADVVTFKVSSVIFSVSSVVLGVIQTIGGLYLWFLKAALVVLTTVLTVLRSLLPFLDRTCSSVECFVLGTSQSSYPIAHPVNDAANRVTPQSAKSDKEKLRSGSSASSSSALSHPHRL